MYAQTKHCTHVHVYICICKSAFIYKTCILIKIFVNTTSVEKLITEHCFHGVQKYKCNLKRDILLIMQQHKKKATRECDTL